MEKNKLGANGGVALADALRVNAKLLYLRCVLRLLCDVLWQHCSVDVLTPVHHYHRLRNNALGSEGGVAIANGLAKNTSLRTVG